MKFNYCPDCGSQLSHKDLGDEIAVPWCDSCSKPWFPLFPCAIIALVYNDRGEVLLLRQSYISTTFRNLVSGYITPGETAESCACREILEETGLRTDRLDLIFTNWFSRKEILMIGFFAHVTQTGFKLSSEVDSAEWIRKEDILSMLSDKPESASRQLAEKFLNISNQNKKTV